MHPIPMAIFSFFLLERPNKYQPLSRSRTRRGGRGRGGGGRYGGGGQQSHSTGHPFVEKQLSVSCTTCLSYSAKFR